MRQPFKNLRRIALILSIALSLEAPAQAVQSSGTSGFSFLNIPTGARAAALGQAFVSVPNDVQGVVYNPASLATMAASQASFEHLSYVADISEEGLAFGHAGRDQEFSWGLIANYLRVANIDRTVATSLPTGDGYTQVGSFSTYDLSAGASLAGPALIDGLSIGATLKFLQESLADASAHGGAFDAGLIYQGNVERSWNAGAAVQNVGFASKFRDAAVKLPTALRLGVSGQPFAQWLFSSDFVKRNDTAGEFDVGAEVTPRKIFSLRFGYRYALKSVDLGGFSNFSGGLGLRFNAMSFDYAFVPLGDLGVTHRISLNYRFKTRRS
jgi:hypothetical protein